MNDPVDICDPIGFPRMELLSCEARTVAICLPEKIDLRVSILLVVFKIGWKFYFSPVPSDENMMRWPPPSTWNCVARNDVILH
jgi:hypothetical protein